MEGAVVARGLCSELCCCCCIQLKSIFETLCCYICVDHDPEDTTNDEKKT